MLIHHCTGHTTITCHGFQAANTPPRPAPSTRWPPASSSDEARSETSRPNGPGSWMRCASKRATGVIARKWRENSAAECQQPDGSGHARMAIHLQPCCRGSACSTVASRHPTDVAGRVAVVSDRKMGADLVRCLALNIPEQACRRALAASPCCWIVGNVAHGLFWPLV